MPIYVYRARNWEGKILTNQMEAENKETIVSKLRERGCFITSITEKKKEIILFEKRIAPAEISIFARQFATMIGSGVPLIRCLTILSEQADNLRFRGIIDKIRQEVEGGSNLSRALSNHGKVFSKLFINLIKAGEAGGILDEILNRLADYLESAEELRQKVKGALTYPAVVMGVAVMVVIFLVVFVLPSFEAIFQDMGDGQLPAPTRLLLGLSGMMNQYFIFFMFGITAVCISIKKFFSTEKGTRILDANLLKVPALGPMMKKVAIAKFTRTLGTLVASGVPILQALEVTAETAGNVIISEAINRTRISIREGESIAEPLKASKIFPSMVTQMIAVGEETGELDTMLTKIADFYEREVDTAVKGLTSIIEPIVIVFMGIVIGGIVLAIFMPLLDIISHTS